MKRNPHMALLNSNYLFPEINLRKKEFLSKNPQAQLISLGIGDTTEPLPSIIAETLSMAAGKMNSESGYSGYGPEQGIRDLREKIAERIYGGVVQADEIIISDGAKCDLGRLQMLFGGEVSIAVQDPAYPVYVDGSLMQGVKSIIPMLCTPENDFFPDLEKLPRTDLIYFCCPNNPTGAISKHHQLKQLVEFAKCNKSIIIFDSAYANFIQEPDVPRSIFEIEGACEVALEVSSFSKLAGFTGIRLGWTVIPKELRYDDGFSVLSDWSRVMSTIFNGASHIAQMGGCAVLGQEGFKKISSVTAYYMENAQVMLQLLKKLNYEVYGGVNGPYLWVRFKGQNSWDVFQKLLEKYHLVTTPGAGFGKGGEEFIRISAFCKRSDVIMAMERLSC